MAVDLDPEPRPLTASEVMRAPDVALLLHVPVSTVHDWARSGRLPSRKRGKHRLFLRPEIDRWLWRED